jgi:hypothetical protein
METRSRRRRYATIYDENDQFKPESDNATNCNVTFLEDTDYKMELIPPGGIACRKLVEMDARQTQIDQCIAFKKKLRKYSGFSQTLTVT